MSPPELADRLAAHAVSREFSHLSPRTADATVDALVDGLACALGGTNGPGMAQARSAMAPWGHHGSSVWGGFGQAPAPVAAFLNAGSLHALDYDDTDDQVPLHAGGVVLPVLLADLEQHRPDCDGREFLTALAVGLDAAMRIGRAGGPKGTRGWNYSVLCASMGAVLALARLRRWSAGTAVNALGLQLAQLAGGLQPVLDKSLAVRFLPGFMAKAVLTSAALAQAGVDGPRNVFDGRAGFINLYQEGQFDHAAIEPGLAHCSLVEALSLKPYPACRFTHAAIDLALELHARGLRPQDIGRLRIGVTKQTLNMVGRPFDCRSASVTDAQFSMAYAVALGIARGVLRIGDFTQEAIRDARLGAFAAQKISVERNDAAPTVGMVPVTIQVELANGQRLELATQEVCGSPAKRMSPARLRDKVIDCLQYNQARVGADELIAAVRALREGAPVSGLLKLLA